MNHISHLYQTSPPQEYVQTMLLKDMIRQIGGVPNGRMCSIRFQPYTRRGVQSELTKLEEKWRLFLEVDPPALANDSLPQCASDELRKLEEAIKALEGILKEWEQDGSEYATLYRLYYETEAPGKRAGAF